MREHEGLSIDALLQGALDDPDTGQGRAHLVELQVRGTREIFDRAAAACNHPEPLWRRLGVMILRELGGAPPLYAREAVPIVIAMLTRESSPEIIARAISALGFFFMTARTGARLDRDASAIQAVVARATHKSAAVRQMVAASVPSLLDPVAPSEMAVRVLVVLSNDTDASTRWFAMSSLLDDLRLGERPDVRGALVRRANDADERVRAAARRVASGGAWGDYTAVADDAP